MSSGPFVIVGAGLAGAKAAETLRERRLRRAHRADRRRGRAALRAPAAVQGVPARRVRARRRSTCTPSGFYARPRDRAAARARPSTALDAARREVDARRRRASSATTGCCSPPAPSRGGSRFPAPSSTASTTCARSRTATRCASGSTGGGRVVGHRRRLDRQRGRRLGAPARAGRHGHRPAARCRSSASSGAELGAFYRDVHAEHGVELLLGDRRRGVRGRRRASSACARAAAGGRVRLRGRRRSACVPRDRRSRERRGLEVDNGVLVDERLADQRARRLRRRRHRQRLHPFYGERIRVEHWANALDQGPAAARGDARRGRRLRPHAVLLLRPVRRRHGVLGLRADMGRGRLPRRSRRRASSSPSG